MVEFSVGVGFLDLACCGEGFTQGIGTFPICGKPSRVNGRRILGRMMEKLGLPFEIGMRIFSGLWQLSYGDH